jgi:ribosome-associated translation inhibitor RaiA
MQILVHDNLSTHNSRREDFVLDRVERNLERFSTRVHRMIVSLSETGLQHGVTERRCHIAANLGPLGTVVATSTGEGVHQAVCNAVRQLSQGISRRIGKRMDRRGRQ